MKIRKYNKAKDEGQIMAMIENEKGWDYADKNMSEKYKIALENSITYVACEADKCCGFSRSIDDSGFYVYVCDLLVTSPFRGKNIGSKLMSCIYKDYPESTVYVMSDVDEYYKKINYKVEGAIFKVPNKNLNL